MVHPKSSFDLMCERYNLSKVALSAPQSACATTRNRFIALRHLSLRYAMCGLKVSLLSKIRPRNFVSFTTGMEFPYSFRSGSGCRMSYRQKCMHTVFVLENLKPFSFAQRSILLRQCCSCLSTRFMERERKQMRKSSTYSEHRMLAGKHATMLFIFSKKSVTDRMQPWGTLISCSKVSERCEPIRTRKFLLAKKFEIKAGMRPLRPA